MPTFSRGLSLLRDHLSDVVPPTKRGRVWDWKEVGPSRVILKIKQVAKEGNLIRDRMTLNHSYLLTVTYLSRPGTKTELFCEDLYGLDYVDGQEI